MRGGGAAVSRGEMVWIAGAQNLSVAVANWDWKFKNPAHPSFHTPKCVAIRVATATVSHILFSVFWSFTLMKL